jgi:4-amino-4-deoxy-L-arabinose transferase-like glycosyltransferase
VTAFRTALALLAIVAIALALRLWGIAFGLPYDLTADEPHQIVQALRIGAGEGGPLVSMWHTVGKGGLDYILFFEYGLLYVFWSLTGRVQDAREFALEYLRDPTAFYLVGRVTVAVTGALTTAAVFSVGRQLYDAPTGLAAALIGAVAYFHAAYSHVINVHVAMTLALWAGVAFYLRYEETGRWRPLMVAGLLAGAAIALAYTAAIGLLLMVVALFASDRQARRLSPLRAAAILLVAAAASVALLSPDLFSGSVLLFQNFTRSRAATADGLRGAIDSVTILRGVEWTAYAEVLLKPYNLLTTIGAAIGMAAGVWWRERWTLMLSAATLLLVVLVSAANRGASESYLLPMTPAMWLLCSRGLSALSFDRRLVFGAATAAVATVPLFFTVREDVMLARPDTRVLAKHWIEANVPSGAKILMDGMRFRFVQSAPLNGNRATLERRLADLEESELALSDQMLELYREAAGRVEGPTYDLHSTMYGLDVRELDYYVHACFDYIVVSSFNEKRYETPAEARNHPASARFYAGIRSDPRFRLVYSIDPIVWRQLGPSIDVYEVACLPAGGSDRHASGGLKS